MMAAPTMAALTMDKMTVAMTWATTAATTAMMAVAMTVAAVAMTVAVIPSDVSQLVWRDDEATNGSQFARR